MNVRVFLVTVAASLLAGLMPAAAQLEPTPPGWQIERAILLSRHGVRSPTQTNAELDRLAATAWPNWPVAPGFLSPHGEELMRLMGGYYRLLYGARGLVQADNCPAPGTVAAWTDTDQRTRASGAALLAGMYPRCGNLALRNQADFNVPDPLFHPQPSASCPMDPAATRNAILARIGGSLASIERDNAGPLRMMQSVLCPNGTMATAAGDGTCGEAGKPTAIETDADGRTWFKGPFGLGSRASEAFLMQAAEGLPKDQVAWGRLASDASLQELLTLHLLEMDLTEKTPEIARQHGSNMLNQIAVTLESGHKFPGALPVGQPVRFGLFVGHETNIYNVASLLDLTWQVQGFLPGEASPGGALAFELFSAGSQRYVRIAYYAQTLDEMRNRKRLDYRDPPGMKTVELPACKAQSHLHACPLERFLEIAKAALSAQCLTPGIP
ncbi:MAG: histidine-type phosphatase [Proteobacteria bacterium]|nr:histidine-type phosphatase [Pseudomonadota bacterium]